MSKHPRKTKARPFAPFLGTGILLIAVHLTLTGQTQVPAGGAPTFEVASIKPNNSGSGSSSTNSANGLLRITNQTLQSMIQRAYNVRDFQILGGPSWIRSDRYDVVAKSEDHANSKQTMEMLKTLLANQFQLQLHREIRQGATYSLVADKNGLSLKVAADSPDSGISSGRDSQTGRYTMKGTRSTMDEIAASLAGRVGRPVINKTAITGKFDFELSWIPDLTVAGASGDVPPDSLGPSIFTAVQEQLGLKLESDKGEIEVLIIDKAEKPPSEYN